MGLSYTWQKLFGAMDALVGDGSLEDRLYFALLSTAGLDLQAYIGDPDGDPDLRNRWDALRRTATRVEASGGEGKYRATLAVMPLTERQAMAKEFLSLFDAIAQQLGAEDLQRKLDAGGR
ncbi:MAG: hypothetical protein LC804_09885 [Acidobacteria bacterium]|nr:hypothetical protein [Acidobacteriota bacterium]